MKPTFDERFGKYTFRFQESNGGFIGIVVGHAPARMSVIRPCKPRKLSTLGSRDFSRIAARLGVVQMEILNV